MKVATHNNRFGDVEIVRQTRHRRVWKPIQSSALPVQYMAFFLFFSAMLPLQHLLSFGTYVSSGCIVVPHPAAFREYSGLVKTMFVAVLCGATLPQLTQAIQQPHLVDLHTRRRRRIRR